MDSDQMSEKYCPGAPCFPLVQQWVHCVDTVCLYVYEHLQGKNYFIPFCVPAAKHTASSQINIYQTFIKHKNVISLS